MNPEGFRYYICKNSVSNIVIKNNDERTNIVFPWCVRSQRKEPRMYERLGRSCLKRTINVKAPGIMGEVLNLTKQSCTNTTTSKPYLRRKWRENRVILNSTQSSEQCLAAFLNKRKTQISTFSVTIWHILWASQVYNWRAADVGSIVTADAVTVLMGGPSQAWRSLYVQCRGTSRVNAIFN